MTRPSTKRAHYKFTATCRSLYKMPQPRLEWTTLDRLRHNCHKSSRSAQTGEISRFIENIQE